jgi:hypothetical protein
VEPVPLAQSAAVRCERNSPRTVRFRCKEPGNGRSNAGLHCPGQLWAAAWIRAPVATPAATVRSVWDAEQEPKPMAQLSPAPAPLVA